MNASEEFNSMKPGAEYIHLRSYPALVSWILLVAMGACMDSELMNSSQTTWTKLNLNTINEVVVEKNEMRYFRVDVVPGTRYVVTLMHCNSSHVGLMIGYDECKGMPLYDGEGGLTEYVTESSSNALYFKISGKMLEASNAKMILMIHEYHREMNEVNQVGPALINAGACYVGTVGSRGQSVYEVNNLIPQADYYISLFALTGDADLLLYTDATYAFLISSTIISTDITPQPEEYVYHADADGKLYLKVVGGGLNREGTTFKILVRKK